MLARTGLVSLAFALAATAQHPGPKPFQWEPDLGTATEKAQQSGRPIAAYFTFET